MGELNHKYIVTGAAGFIGFHLCNELIKNNNFVLGFDNLNEYYDKSLKVARLKVLENTAKESNSSWHFIKGDLEDLSLLQETFKKYRPNIVINLAAQAGVRYSIQNPFSYINSNILGFLNILECCKDNDVLNLIYASSSSVYGGNIKTPFEENDNVDHPINLYAATKKSNELMAHSYSHLYGIPTTGLRLFTVFGPWGRPDMAPMIFIKSILEEKEIKIFNYGNMYRDFTYIQDVINPIISLLEKPTKPNPNYDKHNKFSSESWAPYQILNIGNSKKVSLIDFISCLEEILDKKAIKKFMPIQPGEIETTFSDSSKIQNLYGFQPKTNLKDGLIKLVEWYKLFYKY